MCSRWLKGCWNCACSPLATSQITASEHAGCHTSQRNPLKVQNPNKLLIGLAFVYNRACAGSSSSPVSEDQCIAGMQRTPKPTRQQHVQNLQLGLAQCAAKVRDTVLPTLEAPLRHDVAHVYRGSSRSRQTYSSPGASATN
jgi:hypothetical protein